MAIKKGKPEHKICSKCSNHALLGSNFCLTCSSISKTASEKPETLRESVDRIAERMSRDV